MENNLTAGLTGGLATPLTSAIQEPVSARLEFLIKNAFEIRNQLSATADRVFGPEPRNTAGEMETRSGLFGSLDELSYLMSEIMVMTNRLSGGL